MATHYTRRITLYLNEKEATNDIKSIRTAYMKANSELNKMTLGTKEWVAQMQKVKGLKGILDEHNQSLRNMQNKGFSFSKLSDGFNKYFGIITAGVASFTGAIMGLKKASQAFAEWDDQVADVMKTTGLTKDEVIELDNALQKIDTRSSQEDLLGLARVAGKLGITGKEDVEGFVKAADKIGVALAEDLGGNVEESINQVGKLTDIFGLKNEFGIEEAMLKVGSTINSLGASSTASEEYLVEFTKRMAGVAPAAKISIDQVMGLGATLDQFGQTSEISSTTVSAVLTDMFKSPGQYAEIAGMSITDFNKLLSENSNEAFVKFLEGLKGNNGGLSEMANKLDGLGLEGKRAISVLGVLANNTGTLREQQTLANSEFVKGNSLTNEFNIKNDTAQAKLEKAKKSMALMTRELGSNLTPAMLMSTNGVTYFIKVLSALVNIFKEHGSEILLAVGAIAAYTIALQVNTAQTKLNAVWTKASAVAQTVWSTVVGIVTGKIKIATIVQTAWNAVMAMNPIGAVIAGVMLLAAGVVFLVKRLNSQTAAQKAVNDVTKQAKKDIIEQKIKTEDLLKVAKDEKLSLEERKAALAELNKLSPEYFGNLSIEKSTTEELTKAGEAYIANLEKQALVKAAQAKIDELRTENAEKEIDIQTKSKKWWESEEGQARRATKAINENKEQIEALQGVIDKSTDKALVNTVTNKTVNDIEDKPDVPKGDDKKREEERKKALDKLKAQQDNEIVELKKSMLAKGMLSDEMNAVNEQKEMQLLVALLAMKKRMGEETTDVEGQIVDKQKKIAENYQKQKEDIDKAMVELEKELNEDLDKWFDEQEESQLKDNESSNDEQLKLQEDYCEKIKELDEKYGNSSESRKKSMAEELANLDSLYAAGLISLEKYEKDKEKIEQYYALEGFREKLEYFKAAQDIMSGVSDFYQSLKDAELAKAGNDEKKKEAIEKKYAKKQQTIAIGQAAIKGALAILELWATPSTLPEPAGSIYKGVMSALIAGTTVAQIATISNQKFKTGGYTDNANSDSKQVGIVHANEWVASAPLLRDPETRRHIDYLEARQRGLVPSFDTASISSSLRGFKSGGFTGSSTTVINNASQSDETMQSFMRANLLLLSKLNSEGVKAKADINANEVFSKKEKYDNSVRASEY